MIKRTSVRLALFMVAVHSSVQDAEDNLQQLATRYTQRDYFERVASKLASSTHVQQIVTAIGEVHARLQANTGDGAPFIVVDAPSGSGKTQLGFVLKHLVANSRSQLEGGLADVRHVLGISKAGEGQDIYAGLGRHADNFVDAVARDFDRFSIATQQGTHRLPSVSEINKRQKSFLLTLLASDSGKMPEEATVSTEDFIDQCQSGLPFVLYLDEVAAAGDANSAAVTTTVLLARNIARAARIVAVLAGTSSKTTNMIQVLLSTGRDSGPRLWAYLVTRLPPLIKESVQGRLDSIKAGPRGAEAECVIALIEQAIRSNRGNPRLILLAVSNLGKALEVGGLGLKKRKRDESAPKNGFLWSWLTGFTKDAWAQKRAMVRHTPSQWVWGVVSAELNLLIDGSMYGATADAAIAHHYAWRVLPSASEGVGFWLGLVPVGIDEEHMSSLVRVKGSALSETLRICSGPWDVSRFPTVEEDPLVQLAFIRPAGERLGTRRTTLDAMIQVFRGSSALHNALVLQNPVAISSTGNLVEVILVAALKVAAGKVFMTSPATRRGAARVVEQLLAELNLGGADVPANSKLAEMDAGALLLLGGNAGTIAERKLPVAGAGVGFVRRTENKMEVDGTATTATLSLWEVEFVLEGKDQREKIGPTALEKCFLKADKTNINGGGAGCKRIAFLLSRSGFSKTMPAFPGCEILLASRRSSGGGQMEIAKTETAEERIARKCKGKRNKETEERKKTNKLQPSSKKKQTAEAQAVKTSTQNRGGIRKIWPMPKAQRLTTLILIDLSAAMRSGEANLRTVGEEESNDDESEDEDEDKDTDEEESDCEDDEESDYEDNEESDCEDKVARRANVKTTRTETVQDEDEDEEEWTR